MSKNTAPTPLYVLSVDWYMPYDTASDYRIIGVFEDEEMLEAYKNDHPATTEDGYKNEEAGWVVQYRTDVTNMIVYR